MKTYIIAAALSASVFACFGLHYVLVAIPEQRDRAAMKEAFVAVLNDQKGSAEAALTGRANAVFKNIRTK